MPHKSELYEIPILSNMTDHKGKTDEHNQNEEQKSVKYSSLLFGRILSTAWTINNEQWPGTKKKKRTTAWKVNANETENVNWFGNKKQNENLNAK